VQTTYHVSVDNFVAERALFLVTACFEFGDKPMNCAHCGTAIKWELAFVSAHGLADLCGGTGGTVRVDIPYCPRCEKTPYATGCFYIRDGQDAPSRLAN
jgi:hypothetical protein